MISTTENCNILCLTETHLTPEITDAEIFIENFTIFRGDRHDGRNKGGSIIYIHNNFACARIDSFNPNDSLAVLVDLPNYQLLIACMYRSPSISYNDNLQMINEIRNLKSVIPAGTELMVVGDFNLPNVLWDTGTVECPPETKNKQFIIQKKFVDMFLDAGLFWHLQDGTVTRRRMYDGVLQESHLDQVLTSDPALMLNCQVTAGVGKSDHKIIISRIKCGDVPGYTLSEKKCWAKVTLDDLSQHGGTINWEFTGLATVENIWEHLSEKLKTISELVPSTKIKTSKNGTTYRKSPWDCNGIARKRRAKSQAWQTFEDFPADANLQYALKNNADLDDAINKAMMKYEAKMTSGLKKNLKAFYRYVNSKRNVKQTVVSVKKPSGHLAKTPCETVNILAEFFESTFHTGNSLDNEYHDNYQTNEDYLALVTEEEVLKLLTNLNIYKSTGPDDIHAKLLRALSNNQSFVVCIVLLFNTCLKEGRIPEVWKQANITPIHKKGSVTDAKNYRPISLTSILGKLYEKVVRQRILNEIEEKISSHQHGFVANKSCLSNLLEAVDYINDQLTQDDNVDIFYLDFQKAFDTVPHDKLMMKLKNLGLNNQLLAIITDFLTNREFRVSVGDVFSDPRPVRSGVPQGSVLGPLLFVLYINDMPDDIHNLLLLFADDAKLCTKASNVTANQSDLDKLAQWQEKWGLTFNTNDSKCKVMHIGKANPCNKYLLNGEELPSTTEEKDLGVWLTNDYSWKRNIDNNIKKARSTMAWIMRVIINKDASVMIQLYKSLVRPHLEYCVQLWSPQPRYGNWDIILRIEDVQREFTRQINRT